MSSTALQNDYTRLLYPVARGYTPLYPDAFQPHPSNEFILEGVQIGDLVLRDSIGSVLYIGINITKPADDPRNWQKLPKDYESLLLEPGIDYTVETSHFPSPGILHTTNSVSESFDLRHIPQAGNDTLEKLEFSTSATAGAYCGLPFGGSSHECTPVGLKKVQAFALRHGRSWYHQAIHVDSLDLQNGDLCVVTGCVKASYWMSGLFLSATPNSRFTKRLLVPKVEEGIVQPVRMLENCEEGTTPTILDYSLQSGRKHTANRFAKQTSCIAFRGFHISLGAPIYNDIRRPWTTRQRLWHALPRILRPPMKTWPIFEHQIPPYHPCIAINDLVLSSNRKIKTAVVHDADILSVIQPDEKLMPDDNELARRMIAKYFVIFDSAGRALLKDKSEVKLTRFEERCLGLRCKGVLNKANTSRFVSLRRKDVCTPKHLCSGIHRTDRVVVDKRGRLTGVV